MRAYLASTPRFGAEGGFFPGGLALGQLGVGQVGVDALGVGVDGDAVAVLAAGAIGPPTHASGATWPTTRPCVPPEKRPSVIRPMLLARVPGRPAPP